MMLQPDEIDPFDRDQVLDATGLLGTLNRAGLLAAADLHVTRTMARLLGEDDELVLLALALAVRGVRFGSSVVDLDQVVDDLRVEAPDVEWPVEVDDHDAWAERVRASALAGAAQRVLVVEGHQVALGRYHGLEVSLCDRLVERLAHVPPSVDESVLARDLDRLFAGAENPDQRDAAERAARSWTSVVTGGPGTGKTTTIARLLAALASQHGATGATRPLTIGLAAPTGKAAARMREALRAAADAEVLTDDERTWLGSLDAVTLHRLLGPRPDHRTAFKHHAGQKLAHDVVVVDETSMVSLLMMERLLQAVPSSCRLVLVGDSEQLSSVEAGAVLRDVVDGLGGTASPHVSHLSHGYRFAGPIGDLATAIVSGDAEATLDVLRSGPGQVTLVDPSDVGTVIGGRPLSQARAVAEAAAGHDAGRALELLGEHRLLVAHRDGPAGVSRWNDELERAVRTFPDPSQPWFVGRPVLVTRNDAALGVNNGDVGITTSSDGLLTVELDTGRTVGAARLAAAQTAYASTVHRSQGSEFEHVTLVLPDEDSLVLTRELLYTAVTRARSSIVVVATPEVVRAAVGRRSTRASGLARRLRAAAP